MNIAIWSLVTLVSLAFTFFSIVKLFGVPASLYESQRVIHQERYGLTRTQVRLIGLLELFGGLSILLWATQWQWLAQLGMAALIVVTVGAMTFHYRYDSVTKDGMPALIQFALNCLLLTYTFTWV